MKHSHMALRSRRTSVFPTSSSTSPLLASRADSYPEAARLFGAAEAIRQRSGEVRFKLYDDGYEASVASVREALGNNDFDAAWAEGAALSTEEAIAYAQRGRGARKRPSSGWASLTPTELDVVRLLSEGLGNKEIAERLFISPRTVQTHLTHVYAKLGLGAASPGSPEGCSPRLTEFVGRSWHSRMYVRFGGALGGGSARR